jgi:hypothetical protein
MPRREEDANPRDAHAARLGFCPLEERIPVARGRDFDCNVVGPEDDVPVADDLPVLLEDLEPFGPKFRIAVPGDDLLRIDGAFVAERTPVRADDGFGVALSEETERAQ